MRFSSADLDWKALVALQAIIDAHQDSAAPRSPALQFILAYLFVRAGSKADRKWVFDGLWKEITRGLAQDGKPECGDRYCRSTAMNSALIGILDDLGFGAAPDLVARLRRDAAARGGD